MRVRAAAEIEAEKQRAIADLRAEVADLALAAAGGVVGETMTDERQRRLVEEFLRRLRQRRIEELMARRDTAAATLRRGGLRGRHCATAPSRRGGRTSTPPRPSSADPTVGHALANPAVPLETRPRRAAERARRRRLGARRMNLVGLLLRRGRIEQLPRVAARVPPPRQRPPGHRHRHRHQRRAAQPGRGPGADRVGSSR